MKKVLLLMAGLMVFCGTAVAGSDGFGVSLGYGAAKGNIDVYRFGIKKDYTSKWVENANGYLSGFFELSYNRWEHGGDEVNGLALSPVFAYYFGQPHNFIRPYIAGGIGVTLLDGDRIRDRNLGGQFQFEDRIGAGARIGSFDVNVSYFHYSNAGLKSPNNGMDILMFTGAFHF